MKITIEAEPMEMATLVAELQKQPETEQFDTSIANDAWEKTMQSYSEKLNLRNPAIQT